MQIIIHLLIYFLFFYFLHNWTHSCQQSRKEIPFPFLSVSFQILSWMMSWQQTQFRPFYLDHEKSIVAPQLRVIFTSGKHAEGSNPFSLCSAVVSDSCRGLRHIKLQFVLSKSEGGTKKKNPNKNLLLSVAWDERGATAFHIGAQARMKSQTEAQAFPECTERCASLPLCNGRPRKPTCCPAAVMLTFSK